MVSCAFPKCEPVCLFDIRDLPDSICKITLEQPCVNSPLALEDGLNAMSSSLCQRHCKILPMPSALLARNKNSLRHQRWNVLVSLLPDLSRKESCRPNTVAKMGGDKVRLTGLRIYGFIFSKFNGGNPPRHLRMKALMSLRR